MVIASVIIAIILYIRVDIVFAEHIRQNMPSINILALEQLNEHGPNYVEAGEQHIKFMEELREKVEIGIILRVLYPEYSLEKALEKAEKELDIAIKAGEEGAKRGIYQVGLLSHQYYLLAKKFPRSPIKWSKSEDLPETTLKELNHMLEKFSKDVNNIDIRTAETAVTRCRNACIDSRKIIVKLLSVYYSYRDKEKIQRFLNDLTRARDISNICAQKKDKDFQDERELFEGRYKNMDIRSRILVPLLEGNMHRVCEIINEEKTPLLTKKM
jgi:hypothetical protein